MMPDFSFLDYVWRGLVVLTLTSTLIYAMTWAGSRLFAGRLSARQTKWHLHLQFAMFALVLIGEFLFVAFADPELASGCFEQFVKRGESFTLTRILAGFWLSGTFLLLALDFFRGWLFLRAARAFAPWPEGRSDLREIANRMGIRREVGVVLIRENRSPFAFGWFRHRIALPEAFARSASTEALQSVLAHELAHVRDRDSLWMLSELFCRRLLFFHPFAHSFASHYAMTVEKSADEQAVRKGGIRVSDLLAALLDIAAKFSEARPAPVAIGASRGFREMKARIEALSEVRRPRASGSLFGIFAGLSLLASLGISVAQADVATKGRLEGRADAGVMCTQLRHEQIIESWLRIERETNKCEK